MPKIDGNEVTEESMLDYFRSRGKRVVTEEDYEKKAGAANDLAKLRNLTGDSRSIDELSVVIKGEKDLLGKIRSAEDGLVKMTREVKVRDTNTYVKAAQGALNMKVVDQFMQPFVDKLYDEDPAKLGKELFDAKVKDAITKASEAQAAAFKELGIEVPTPGATPAFGSGGMFRPGGSAGNDNLEAMLRSTAAGASGAAIQPAIPDWMRAPTK